MSVLLGDDAATDCCLGTCCPQSQVHVALSLLLDLVGHIDHVQRRVVQDALAEATAAYWQRIADRFEAAMPRPGDFTSDTTKEELDAKRLELAAIALACRQKAAVSRIGGWYDD